MSSISPSPKRIPSSAGRRTTSMPPPRKRSSAGSSCSRPGTGRARGASMRRNASCARCRSSRTPTSIPWSSRTEAWWPGSGCGTPGRPRSMRASPRWGARDRRTSAWMRRTSWGRAKAWPSMFPRTFSAPPGASPTTTPSSWGAGGPSWPRIRYLSDGFARAFSLGQPFFALDTPWSASVALNQKHAGLYLYDRGQQIFETPFVQDEVQGSAAAAFHQIRGPGLAGRPRLRPPGHRIRGHHPDRAPGRPARPHLVGPAPARRRPHPFHRAGRL